MIQRFTKKDRIIAELLLTGASDEAIRDKTGYQIRAIKAQLRRMRRKFGFTAFDCSRTKLAMYIHERRHMLQVRCNSCDSVSLPAAA